MRTYDKHDAQMTRGLAILCMVVLHLFCRKGADVFGTPLIWLDETTPFVYLFGFFAEICVPLYSICVGYAQELLREKGKSDILSRCARIAKLMVNYWIILVLFSMLGLLFDEGKGMPGSLMKFIKSIVLLDSYNGAWWYLNTYVLLLLIPPSFLFFPVEKMKAVPGMLFCGTVHVLWYLFGKFGLLPSAPDSALLQFAHKELANLIGILAYVWLGGFLCKYRLVGKTSEWVDRHIPANRQKPVLLALAVVVFVCTNIVHKWVVMGGVALIVFFLFNLWEKGEWAKKTMLFLGKHSTNIWLVHMFFYAYFLKGLVLWTRYPVLMLASLLVLSIITSYAVMFVERRLQKLTEGIRNR